MQEAAVPGEDAPKRGDFHVIRAPDWVNVVALTAERELVLIEQWRHGIELVTLEIPGGMVDDGESAETAGRRELLEETGYSAERWEKIGAVRPNPAIQDNTCHTYLARDAVRTATPAFDSHERCVLRLERWDDTERLVRGGHIDHALVVAALSFATMVIGRNR